MPISPITLQRRFAELGRIRLGAKEGGKGRPMKLAAFRFTSANRRYIDDLATLYGGQPRPWDNNGKPEFEVFTDATSIPVIAMKGGLSQWMETWSGGGCVHRCDGERGADGTPCDPNDRAHADAKPTTRLSLMLPELDAIGAWRMESHGWNAAAEIPAVAELAQFVGDLVPAHLNMIERRSVRDGKTSRFVVPVLDLQIGAARLREIVAEKSGTAELDAPAAGGHRELGAGPSSTTEVAATPAASAAERLPTVADIQAATRVEGVFAIYRYLQERDALTPELDAACRTRRAELEQATAPGAGEQAPAQQELQPDEDGAYPAETVEDPPTAPAADPAAAEADAGAVWQQVLAAGGERGMTMPDLEDDFAARMGGLTSAEASVGELQHYLRLITEGAAA
ncbi:hypothetical protein [Microcystis phage MinS1]|nr:hypothetical protein [Microcystis phage MinS1]